MKKIHSIIMAVLSITIISTSISAKKRKPVAYNCVDSAVIAHGSIVMPKGKMCLWAELVYETSLPGWDIFKNKSKPKPGVYYMGANVRVADTTITSNILVRSAMYELLGALPPGIEYTMIESDDSLNVPGASDESLPKEQSKADVVVCLRGVVFSVKGELDISSVLKHSADAGNSYLVGSGTYYSGDIHIGYQASWKISWKDGRIMELKQKGWRKSRYNKTYDFTKDLLSFSKEVGSDFAKLLTRKK